MRQKILIYGNCQGAALQTVLTSLPHVTERFDITLHDVNLQGAELEASLPDYADADLMFIQQIHRWRSHPMRNRLAAGAKVVPFPGLGHMAPWPFDGVIAGKDPAFVQFRPFAFGDHAMGCLRALISDPAERLTAYRALDWEGAPKKVDLMRNQTFELSRLLRMDEKFETSLGRFIVDHFRSAQLFHAVHHPAGILMSEFVAQMLDKAGLYEDSVRGIDVDLIGQFQVPIHPLVADALEIDWATPERTYRLHDDIYLDFDAYYSLYIQTYG